MEKVIITAALTGGNTPKDVCPALPMTPEEIAEDAYQCWKVGASVVHLHMRDDEGKGSLDSDKFAETIHLIRSHNDCDLVINCSSSGMVEPPDEVRLHHFQVNDGVEMGTFDAGTINWMPNDVFYNTPQFLVKLGTVFKERGIKPEIEIFDAGMLGIVNYYVEKGILSAPLHYQFCLGVKGGMDATVENLLYLSSKLPAGSTWSAFGVGRDHLPMLYAALALGGNVRVGLEDNIYYSKGVKATNVQLVERAAAAIRLFGKEPATGKEAREILGLSPLF